MTRLTLFGLIAVLTLAVWPADQADARRFGGGLSFGSHHRSFSPGHARRPVQTAPKAAQQANRPRSGFMGAIAGLAMGGLLGALLFGGAFEGINLFDILLIGGIIFAIMWWFRRQAQQVTWQQQTATAPHGGAAVPEQNHAYVDTQQSAGGAGNTARARPDIDVGPFLNAARAIFVRMQTAWDKGDLDDIRRFCTPEVADHVARQMRESAGQRHETETVTLEAELVDSWLEEGREWAAVRFTAMMKERTLTVDDGALLEESNTRVEEIWSFCHDPAGDDPTWFVTGITQTS